MTSTRLYSPIKRWSKHIPHQLDRGHIILICSNFALAFALMLTVVFTPQFTPISAEKVSYIYIKYIIVDRVNHEKTVEVVDKVWINGAGDYNNRHFRFRRGETVSFTAPETLMGAKFAFWQREETPTFTFQGLIVTNRTLTITVDDENVVWWGNYYGDLP